MVMTQTALLFLGAIALITTVGMFLEFDDRWTNVVIAFLAALLWGFFGINSFDVLMVEIDRSEPIMTFVILGVGLAGIIGLYAVHQFFKALGDDVEEAGMLDGLE